MNLQTIELQHSGYPVVRGLGLFAGGGESVRVSRLWINVAQSLFREMCSGKSMSLGLNLTETVVREF